ncbi:MAG TPA: HEAT repeat domain-containing protein, partial [Vicinamibacteria bacterium]
LVLTILLLIRPPAGDDVWVSYELPSGTDSLMCCFDWDRGWKNDARQRTCRLDGGGSAIFTDSKGTFAHLDSSRMVVYVRFVKGTFNDVKIFNVGCAVDPGRQSVRALAGVTTDDSATFFEEAIAKGDGRKAAEKAIFALAMHSSPRVVPILERLSLSGPRSLREDAIFWLAQTGGRRGYETVRRLAVADPDQEIRKKAVFSLTQSEEAGALDDLASIARTHRDVETRAEAIFWLGQEGGVKVLPILEEFLESGAREIQEKAVFAIGQIEDEKAQRKLLDLARKHGSSYVRKQALFWLGQQAERAIASTLGEFVDDPDSEMREMAVFAISQRPREESIPELIRLIRTHRDPSVRKQAVFWLSQMDDPRATAEIERIIIGESRR